MLATVDDVHHGNRHLVLLPPGPGRVNVRGHEVRVLQLTDVLVQLHAKGHRAGPRHGHGDGQNRVGAKRRLWEAPLILGAIQLVDHDLIKLLLKSHVLSLQSRSNHAVDVGDGLDGALPHVALAAIAHLNSLVDARGGSTRHRRCEGAVARGERGLHCGVAAAVHDLTTHNADDLGLVVRREVRVTAVLLPWEDACGARNRR
mmetsp:Transcript_31164/g.97781  ORF Transcript_31164/g.97781 Transcript_31164/m.97781 type:complete len:202 (+) Transcript_31164:262-867(+)